MVRRFKGFFEGVLERLFFRGEPITHLAILPLHLDLPLSTDELALLKTLQSDVEALERQKEIVKVWSELLAVVERHFGKSQASRS